MLHKSLISSYIWRGVEEAPGTHLFNSPFSSLLSLSTSSGAQGEPDSFFLKKMFNSMRQREQCDPHLQGYDRRSHVSMHLRCIRDFVSSKGVIVCKVLQSSMIYRNNKCCYNIHICVFAEYQFIRVLAKYNEP